MVFKTLSERLKQVKARLEKAKAKHHGMTVPELRQYLAERKTEKRKFKAELRRKEREERQKYAKWKIEQKYKQKRKQPKKGKGLGVLELFGGSTSKGETYDPLGILGPAKKKRKKRSKKR